MAENEDGLVNMGDLDDLLAAARTAPPQMPQSLQTAILRDAQDVQQTRARAQAGAVGPVQTGGLARLWGQFSAAIGGWPALGGLAVASLTGLWIGVAPPAFVSTPVDQIAVFATGASVSTDQSYNISFLMSDEVFE